MKKILVLLVLLFTVISLVACTDSKTLECLDTQELINEECVDVEPDPVVETDNLFKINTGNTEGWELFTNFKDEPQMDIRNGIITFTQVYEEGSGDSKNTWSRKLAYSSMTIESNANYTFTFTAIGTAGESFTVYLETGNENRFVEEEYTLDGTNQQFSFDLFYPVPVSSGGLLKFGFGTFNDGSTVTISNITITEVEVLGAEMNVLFLGNSFTFFHNMPTMLEDMGKTKGHSINVEQITYGGYQLSNFLDQESSIYHTLVNTLEGTDWDYVVIQEQSFKPILYKEAFLEDVGTMNQLITSNGAEVILFNTWSYREGSVMLENTGYTYTEFSNLITAAYIEAEETYNTLRAPVGTIFYNLTMEHPEIDLIDLDNFHPSVTGSFTAALTFYTMIYGEESNQYLPDEVSSETARIIRNYVYNVLESEE